MRIRDGFVRRGYVAAQEIAEAAEGRNETSKLVPFHSSHGIVKPLQTLHTCNQSPYIWICFILLPGYSVTSSTHTHDDMYAA